MLCLALRGGTSIQQGNTTFDLTDHEGTFLSLVLRIQPTTAYQVTKVYEESPVSNFNTSKGKIYPIIRRLAERGLLAKREVAGDGRGTEELFCTDAGRDAVRAWVKQIRETHILLDDPLRTKVQSFGLLSFEERIAWIAAAKQRLQRKVAELEHYRTQVDAPFKESLHENAVQSIRARISWLNLLMREVVNDHPVEAARQDN